MDNRDWPKVRRGAERQGWAVEETRNGFVLKSPDGDSIVAMDRLHTSSDQHALDWTVRRMQRAGFSWPPPTRGGR